MKTAQPRVPDREHRQIKAEAKRRGMKLEPFYAEVIREGLKAVKERK